MATKQPILSIMILSTASLVASAQTGPPAGYSIATPKPISPAEGTTNPSALATQRQNPYLGSVPAKSTLIQRRIIHPRSLVILSVSIVAAAMWHFSTFTLATDCRHYVMARAFSGFGIRFLLRTD